MNRKITFISGIVFIATLCLLDVLPAFASTPDSWTTKTSMPYPTGSRIRGASAVVDGKIFVVATGGYLEVYDPKTDTWTEKTRMPYIAEDRFAIAACQNKIYVINGWRTSIQPNFVEVYDPATDTWSSKTPSATERYGFQANVVDGKIYCIGGGRVAGLYIFEMFSNNEVYDPATDSWSQIAPIPTPVTNYASAVFDKKIYVIGGMSNFSYLGGGKMYAQYDRLVQIFDPKTGQWSQGTPLPNPVSSGSACTTEGLMSPKRIYFVGGNTNPHNNFTSLSSSTQIYNPENGLWSYGASMPKARYGLSLANVDDMLYALGGVDDSGQQLTVNEQYTPLGYGSIVTASPSPTPTPKPTPTMSPTPTPTPSPSTPPTTTPSPTLEPTQTPTANNDQPWVPYATVGLVATSASIAAIYIWRKKKKKTKIEDFQHLSSILLQNQPLMGR